MVFEPADPYDVENDDPEPDDGEPPLALQDRELTFPVMLGLQVMLPPVATLAGVHPRELITGAEGVGGSPGVTSTT